MAFVGVKGLSLSELAKQIRDVRADLFKTCHFTIISATLKSNIVKICSASVLCLFAVAWRPH